MVGCPTVSTPGLKYPILLANIFFVQINSSGVQVLKFKFEFFSLDSFICCVLKTRSAYFTI